MTAAPFAVTLVEKKLVTYDTFCRNHSVISVFEAPARMFFEIKLLNSKFLQFLNEETAALQYQNFYKFVN